MSKLSRPLLGVLVAAALLIFVATPAFANGKENWQVGFSGTGVIPGTGQGFGFWGWCSFGGGVTSGNNGDCEFAQYIHGPSGFTCHESINVSSWDGSSGAFVINAATITVTPTGETRPCLALFPGPAGLPVNTGIPAAPGHYNLGGIGGVVGEFQIQVTQIQ